MNWYKIEYYDVSSVRLSLDKEYALSHRIALIERQYTTRGRAESAAERMMYKYPNVVTYTITPISVTQD